MSSSYTWCNFIIVTPFLNHWFQKDLTVKNASLNVYYFWHPYLINCIFSLSLSLSLFIYSFPNSTSLNGHATASSSSSSSFLFKKKQWLILLQKKKLRNCTVNNLEGLCCCYLYVSIILSIEIILQQFNFLSHKWCHICIWKQWPLIHSR